MSTTTVTHESDIPDYRGGLLTATEYALIEAGALSGRASVHNALARNGYTHVPQVGETGAIPIVARRREMPAISRSQWWLEALALVSITIGCCWVLLWAGSRLWRLI